MISSCGAVLVEVFLQLLLLQLSVPRYTVSVPGICMRGCTGYDSLLYRWIIAMLHSSMIRSSLIIIAPITVTIAVAIPARNLPAAGHDGSDAARHAPTYTTPAFALFGAHTEESIPWQCPEPSFWYCSLISARHQSPVYIFLVHTPCIWRCGAWSEYSHTIHLYPCKPA